MSKFDPKNQILNHGGKAERRETVLRADMARRGYRLMHRRNGQYWVMFDEPMTLDEIEARIKPHKAR